MPTQLFYSVTIPVTLWFVTRGKKQTGKTLFIDARNMGHMVDRKHRDFSEEDITRLADTFTAFQKGTLEDVKASAQLPPQNKSPPRITSSPPAATLA